ncbi:MAG: adenylate/guanylate cyclase domain-containing protein, partial [Candidatus Fermentibacteraceae bacterium]
MTLENMSMVLDDALDSIAGTGAFSCGGTAKLSEGERRRAAVLFLDLTGFTLLSESMDHEELHVLLGRIMGLLSTVVASYGGYVDKFEGDRLMALFGAVTATENDSVRAVGCALRMLELLEDIRGALGGATAVSARVGIDFGPLTVAPDPSGHMTATGHTVNIASRLEEAAVTGSTLVSGAVRKECGDLYTWQDLGSMPVRGTGSVIDAFRPLGPGRLRMERWQRAARLAGSPFVGRKEITDTIVKALQASSAEGSEPAVFMICADAGIGKSRLAHHCVSFPAGFRILHGKALSHAQPSCWLWISLLRDFLDADENTDCSREFYASGIRALSARCPVARTRAALDNLAENLSEILSLDAVWLKGGATANSQAVMNAIRPALEAVFSIGDTLLLLEDLHWADEVSLSVLRGVLSQGMMVQPSGIIMTSRPPVPDLGTPLCAPSRIELAPLSDSDSIEIAAHILSLPPRKPLQPELAELIRRVARGNPFVVEELVLSLIESGGLKEVEPGTWEQTVPCDRVRIPSSISVLTQARMDRLPGEERRTLQYASVLGERFSRELLEAVLKDLSLDGESLGLTIAGLLEKGFLSEMGPMGLGFRHALVRMAAYETLLKQNARLLHRTAALAMERLYPTELDALSPVILSHWDGARDTDNSLKWALRAMRIARDGGRPEEANSLSERILELAGDAPDDRMWQATMQALLVRQEMVERGGSHEEALGIIDRMLGGAEVRKSPFWLATSLRARAKVLQELGWNSEFERTIQDALSASEASGDEIITAKTKMTLANHRSS